MQEPTMFVKNVCNIYDTLDKTTKYYYCVLGLETFIKRCAKMYIYNPTALEMQDIYSYCIPFEKEN